MKDHHPLVSLKTYSEHRFLPQVMGFVEMSARAFGLTGTDLLKLTLACEEVFSYLTTISTPSKPVIIEVTDGIYCLRVKFVLERRDLNLRALNITATLNPDGDASPEDMGLLIASRSVEHFAVLHQSDEGSVLLLVKEKSYPGIRKEMPVFADEPERFRVRPATPDRISVFVRETVNRYDPALYPEFFAFPGKVIDMVESGEFGVVLALDDQGRVGGGMLWHWGHKRMIETYGPYLFFRNETNGSSVASSLLDAVIGWAGKSDAYFLLTKFATPQLPPNYYEPLGIAECRSRDGVSLPSTYYFRQLREDAGSQVWCHPLLREFLTGEYGRLALPRQIRLTSEQGEARPSNSVFSVLFSDERATATLSLIVPGRDVSENLERHLSVLASEGTVNIFFKLDLHMAWQAELTPLIKEQGFEPALLLPYGGDGDVVVFQHLKG